MASNEKSEACREGHTGFGWYLSTIIATVLVSIAVPMTTANAASSKSGNEPTVESCTPDPEAFTQSGSPPPNLSYSNPPYDNVGITRSSAGLTVRWILTGKPIDPGIGSGNIWGVFLYPRRSSVKGIRYSAFEIKISRTNLTPAHLTATAEVMGGAITKTATPRVSGDVLTAHFGPETLRGLPATFYWSATEDLTQIGVPTGDPTNPIEVYPGSAIAGGAEACPSPSNGYGTKGLPFPQWNESDLAAISPPTAGPKPIVNGHVVHDAGGILALDAAIDAAFKGGTFYAFDNPTVSCAAPPSSSKVLPPGTVLACRATAIDGRTADFFASSRSPNLRSVTLDLTYAIECSSLSKAQAAALEALEQSTSCVSPTGLAIPRNAGSPPMSFANAVLYGPIPSGSSLSEENLAAAVVLMVRDPGDSAWAEYFVTPSAANTGLFPTNGGLAHFVGTSWNVVSGPYPDLGCNLPTGIPSSVLRWAHVSHSVTCTSPPPTTTTEAPTTTTTSAPPSTQLSPDTVAQVLQSEIRAGTAPGAGAVADAVVVCGPPNAPLSPGSYLACNVNSASVGGAEALLEMTGPGPTDFTLNTIGSGNLCMGEPPAAVAALNAWSQYQGRGSC